MAKTIHVYHWDSAWAVNRDGKISIFSNKRNAVQAAKRTAKGQSSGQLVVHGRGGRIEEYKTYGLPRVQTPPKKGRFANGTQAAALRKALFARIVEQPSERAT
jgi:hypothetical protein